MITKEDKDRIFALFDLGARPLPKFPTIISASTEVIKTWDRGNVPHNVLVRLWKKLEAQGAEAVVTELEYPLLARVLFSTTGEGLYPLMSRHDVLVYVSKLVMRANDPQLALDFAKTFLRLHEPTIDLVNITRWAAKVALRCQPGKTFVRDGFFDVAGPKRMAMLLAPADPVDAVVEQLGGELLDPHSAYANAVWRLGLDRYSSLVASSRSDPMRFSTVLDFIRRDSQTSEGYLRSPADAEHFACAVAEPFLKDPRDMPSSEVREALFNFFVYFFGDPRDTGNTRWESIRASVGDLFKIWKTGEDLESLFLFVGDALRVPPKHWEDRRPFWFRYWRAGRISGWGIYTSPTMRTSCLTRASLRKRYPNILSELGVLKNRPKTNFMLLFELDNNILVSEFSDQGAIRIGHPNARINTKLKVLDWSDLVEIDDKPIAHRATGSWRVDTDRRIAELSGLRSPR